MLLALLSLAALFAQQAPAHAAYTDPLFFFQPVRIKVEPPGELPPPLPPPSENLNGPCGMAVDSQGNFYVSDYYRHNIDIWDGDTDYSQAKWGRTGYVGQLAEVDDPLDGPCELALNASDALYVNDYHRGVLGYGAFPLFGAPTTFPLPSEDTPHHLPTGVAVDPSSGLVYVDNRTYVSVYEADGTPLLDGSGQVRIGVGSLEDGYGLAYSQYPGTAGDLYVPDAGSNTVKIYDSQAKAADPVAEIDGSSTPPGHFVSLREAAIAVDRVSGDVYVVDNLQPLYTEQPEAIVYVFNAAGAYLGHLKVKVSDALPVGLAVDNSPRATYPYGTQGQVYVTSSNTELAAIYGYRPGAATTATAQQAAFGLSAPNAGGSTSDSGVTSSWNGSEPGPSAPATAPRPTVEAPAVAATQARTRRHRRHVRHRHRRHRHRHRDARR